MEQTERSTNEKMGAFISSVRKAKNLTQKDVAEALGITDKAVSKWERGISCPDISLLVPLARLLDVSTGELLNGERLETKPPEAAEAVIEEALTYSAKKTKIKLESLRKVMRLILTLSVLAAGFICLLCDYCITGEFTWSLIILSSLLFGWLLLLPLFGAGQKKIRNMLVLLSVLIIPYLLTLKILLGIPLILTLGACISLISIIGLWIIYALFANMRQRKLLAGSLAVLILVPVEFTINYTIEHFTASQQLNPLINILSLFFLAVILYVIDFTIGKFKPL